MDGPINKVSAFQTFKVDLAVDVSFFAEAGTSVEHITSTNDNPPHVDTSSRHVEIDERRNASLHGSSFSTSASASIVFMDVASGNVTGGPGGESGDRSNSTVHIDSNLADTNGKSVPCSLFPLPKLYIYVIFKNSNSYFWFKENRKCAGSSSRCLVNSK